MPKLDNLRESDTSIDSGPFVIATGSGERLFVGRVRLIFNTKQAGVQVVMLHAQPGVKIVYPRNGFLDFLPDPDHDDDPKLA